MKKRLVYIITAMVMLVALCVPVSAAFDSSSRHSVAVVYSGFEYSSGFIGYGSGSCFFVGIEGENPTYLVTNYHVIESFMNYGEGDLVTLTTTSGSSIEGRSKLRVYYDSESYDEAYVVGYDELADVAVLKLASPTSERSAVALCSPDDSMVGSAIYAIGYPGIAENDYAGSTTSWGESDSTVTSGTLSRVFVQSGTGVEQLQIDCTISAGNSGGPLLNDDGAVIGINTYTVSSSSASATYAISISEAISILRQYGIEYSVLSTGSVSDTASLDSESEATIETVVIVEEEASSGLGTGVIIAIAAVVIIIVMAVAIIVVMKSKKKAKPVETPPQQTVSHEARPQKKAVVRSLSQQHGGTKLSLNGQIVIGRGSDCAIVFRENTPGVSGRHCSLSWNAASGAFQLIDLGSTYGTFLENGTKLRQGVAYELQPGDRFYLGDKANMLEVNLE